MVVAGIITRIITGVIVGRIGQIAIQYLALATLQISVAYKGVLV
jgi:hypothetical protein